MDIGRAAPSAPMHHALTELMSAVADEARWERALKSYAVSLDGDHVGWFVLAGGPEQLVPWGSDFSAQPDGRHWLPSPLAPSGPALVGTGLSEEVTRQYAAHYRARDPLWDAAMARYAHTDTWVVVDAPRGLLRESIHRDFLKPHGIGVRMFGGSRGAAQNLFASIYREHRAAGDDDGFGDLQQHRFRMEFPAVQRAAQLHLEVLALRARTQGLEALMERMPVGLLFLDTEGRLLHANARALALTMRPALRHLLRGPRDAANAALGALFEQALRGVSGCVELPGGMLLVALAIGELASLGLHHPAPGVACLLMERQHDAASAVALAAQAWRLSPAESALLLALLQGQTPQDFADARGVRMRTVRTQLSTLLLKTRTARQQELVALVAQLTPLVAAA